MDLAQFLDITRSVGGRIIRLDLTGFLRLLRVNSMFKPKRVVWNFSHTKKLFNTVSFPATGRARQLPKAPKASVEKCAKALNDFNFAKHRTDRQLTAFLAMHKGKLCFEEYYQKTKRTDIRIGWSVSKGLIAILVGILIDKKVIKKSDLDRSVTPLVPMLNGSGYDGVTLRNLLNMSSGVAFNEDYIDYHSDINKLGRILGIGGSMDEFAASLVREYDPGTWRHYVSIDTHVIGMALRALTGENIQDLYHQHLMLPMLFEAPAHCIADSFDQPFVLGGMNFCTSDYARIGQMMLDKGKWNGQQIVSAGWIEELITPSAPPPYPGIQGTPDAECLYGMHWWRPPNPQKGEFFAIGIYGQMIYVNRNSQLVLVQNATDLNFRDGEGQVLLNTLSFYRHISNAIAT
ncbi:MAG: serine hydrolase [Pseudomonadota bacterium]